MILIFANQSLHSRILVKLFSLGSGVDTSQLLAPFCSLEWPLDSFLITRHNTANLNAFDDPSFILDLN